MDPAGSRRDRLDPWDRMLADGDFRIRKCGLADSSHHGHRLGMGSGRLRSVREAEQEDLIIILRNEIIIIQKPDRTSARRFKEAT